MIVNEAGAVTHLTILLLGDAAVGKSSFIQTFLNPSAKLKPHYEPTLIDSHSIQYIMYNSTEKNDMHPVVQAQRVILHIIDIGSNHKSLQNDSINDADAFLIMYNVADETSFKSCYDYYEKIVRFKFATHSAVLPIILVGTQVDVTSSTGSENGIDDREISFEIGSELAEILQVKFMETTCKAPASVSACFKSLVQLSQAGVNKEIIIVDETNGHEEGVGKKGSGVFKSLFGKPAKSRKSKEVEPTSGSIPRIATAVKSPEKSYFLKPSKLFDYEQKSHQEVTIPEHVPTATVGSLRMLIDKAYQDSINHMAQVSNAETGPETPKRDKIKSILDSLENLELDFDEDSTEE